MPISLYPTLSTHLSDCSHIAGAAVVLQPWLVAGGGAAWRAAAEPTDRLAGRGLVVEDVHGPAVGSHCVVHEVDSSEQDTVGEAQGES